MSRDCGLSGRTHRGAPHEGQAPLIKTSTSHLRRVITVVTHGINTFEYSISIVGFPTMNATRLKGVNATVCVRGAFLGGFRAKVWGQEALIAAGEIVRAPVNRVRVLLPVLLFEGCGGRVSGPGQELRRLRTGL